MPSSTIYEGTFESSGSARIAIVASRFNHFVVDRLVDGAMDALLRHGIREERVEIVRVAGAWEIPLACKYVIAERAVDGIVALGAVIRGATPHFNYVSEESIRGCANLMLESAVPIGLGILTTESIEQAIERAGTKAGNKGWDAAMSVLEMVSLRGALRKKSETPRKSRSR